MGTILSRPGGDGFVPSRGASCQYLVGRGADKRSWDESNSPPARAMRGCVERVKGHPSPFLAVINTTPIAVLCERNPAFVISIQSSHWQRNACDRMSNRMRTGCCGRRFSVAPGHHPRRPGAATHARKTRVFCSLPALRRVAG